MEEKNKTVLAWVGVLVVIFGSVLLFTRPQQDRGNVSVPAELMPAYAPQGHIIPRFPQALILDKNPSILQSYTINYSSGLNQYTVQWNSSTTPDALATKYKIFFPANGWTFAVNKTVSTSLHSISAKNAVGSALVSIIPHDKGSQAIVTYLAQ